MLICHEAWENFVQEKGKEKGNKRLVRDCIILTKAKKMGFSLGLHTSSGCREKRAPSSL